MAIFDAQGGPEALNEAYDLALATSAAGVIPPGWQQLSAADLNISASLVDAAGNFTDSGGLLDAQAKVFAKTDADGNITNLAVSFAPTNNVLDVVDYLGLLNENYDNAFDYLFEAVRDFAVGQGLTGEDVQFAGYSLGGGAVNLAAEERETRLDGFFADSQYFGLESPVIAEGENVFNFGLENDVVFRVAGAADAPTFPDFLRGNDNEFASSTDNIVLFNDTYANPNFASGNLLFNNFSLINLEAWSAHIEVAALDPSPIERIAASSFYEYTELDSTIILSGLSDATRGSTFVAPVDRATGDHTQDNAFVLGTDNGDLIGDGQGDDFLDGFAGDDIFRVGAGNDSVNGGEGTDTVQLSGTLADYEIVRLSDGTVFLADIAGAFELEELAAVERVDAGGLQGLELAESGVIQAGVTVAAFVAAIEGTDTADALGGTGGRDRIFGDDGNDTISGDDGADLLQGGDGDDGLGGGVGDDQLFGAAGADVIEGGLGDDLLFGGIGSDRFVFDESADDDTIGDFGVGDVIAFMEGVFADFTELISDSEQVGNDVVISFDDSSLTLEDVALAELDADDFLFA